MTEDHGFDTIARAWERVFEDVVAMGSRVADIYRSAYEAERASRPEEVEAEEGDRMRDVSQTVELSLRAARDTFEEVSRRATASERPRELTREIEDAVAVSLSEVGSALQRLSDQIGRDRDESSA
ncbi:MAG: hypothetical protein IT198_17070 [Acidimicrobiia bacterium]|nr:hypothetical protein [Acidimicrobiia bacterium]